MKRVILFRHAKSDWSADYDGDHERPLKKRGRNAAKQMGRFLENAGLEPDVVMSSSAVRARQTAEHAIEAGKWRCVLEISGSLYGSPAAPLVNLLRDMPPDCKTIVAVGHEPTWSEAVGLLCGGANVRMPTAAMACLEADIASWTEIALGACTLMWLVTPKLLSTVER